MVRIMEILTKTYTKDTTTIATSRNYCIAYLLNGNKYNVSYILYKQYKILVSIVNITVDCVVLVCNYGVCS